MKQNRTLIVGLQGAAGAGKTSVARKLCKKLPGKSARVSVDILRDMSCINFETQRQSDEHILAAKRICPDLAKLYLKEGFNNVVIEFAPPVDFDEGKTDKLLANKLKKMGGKIFLIHASLEEVLKRNAKRKGEFGGGGLPKKLAKKLYKNYEKYVDKNDFSVVDTEKIGADKTTDIILKKLK